MVSSTIKVAAGLLIACLNIHAQTPAQQLEPGSIGGKVTLKGRGIAGIVVGARRMESGSQRNTLIATTDQDGRYRISNVAPGQYVVLPATGQFIVADSEPTKTLFVGEGENVDNLDFTVVRGAVITGKVVDSDGRPLIEQSVEAFREKTGANSMGRMRLTSATDDRGIYRIFGLLPGKYKVAAGGAEDRLPAERGRHPVFSKTFHPSTAEASNATLIELSEGSEATNVDITLQRLHSVFTVMARVIDAETGRPIANARYGLERLRENGSLSTSGMSTNALGEIRLENVTPGKYSIFINASPPGAFYSDPVRFEVVDRDIRDLVIKASSGGSVSGVIVLDGVDEKLAGTQISDLTMVAHVLTKGHSHYAGQSPSTKVNPDGSFTLEALRAGNVVFSIWRRRQDTTTEFDVARVERDGVVQPNLQIRDREQITGLRVIVRPRSGRIRGVVKFENKQVLPSRVQAFLKTVGGDDNDLGMSLEMDGKSRFMSQALVAGVYEVVVIGYPMQGPRVSTKQQVVVADNQVTEVVLTLDFKSDKPQERR